MLCKVVIGQSLFLSFNNQTSTSRSLLESARWICKVKEPFSPFLWQKKGKRYLLIFWPSRKSSLDIFDRSNILKFKCILVCWKCFWLSLVSYTDLIFSLQNVTSKWPADWRNLQSLINGLSCFTQKKDQKIRDLTLGENEVFLKIKNKKSKNRTPAKKSLVGQPNARAYGVPPTSSLDHRTGSCTWKAKN